MQNPIFNPQAFVDFLNSNEPSSKKYFGTDYSLKRTLPNSWLFGAKRFDVIYTMIHSPSFRSPVQFDVARILHNQTKKFVYLGAEEDDYNSFPEELRIKINQPLTLEGITINPQILTLWSDGEGDMGLLTNIKVPQLSYNNNQWGYV
jgi:hypothetical protein